MSASQTTVGALRAFRGGPNLPLLGGARAFPGAQDADPGAWCWVSHGPQEWTVYAVGPHRAVQRVAVEGGMTTTPTGMPVIP